MPDAVVGPMPARLRIAQRPRQVVDISPGRPDPVTGLRLATAFIAPIALGQALGETISGLFVGIGAFMVANADLGGPYPQRARVQLAVACCVPASIVAGMVCGEHDAIALPVAVILVTAGAFAGAISNGAAIAGVLAGFGVVIGIGVAGTPADGPFRRAVELLIGAAFAMPSR